MALSSFTGWDTSKVDRKGREGEKEGKTCNKDPRGGFEPRLMRDDDTRRGFSPSWYALYPLSHSQNQRWQSFREKRREEEEEGDKNVTKVFLSQAS